MAQTLVNSRAPAHGRPSPRDNIARVSTMRSKRISPSRNTCPTMKRTLTISLAASRRPSMYACGYACVAVLTDTWCALNNYSRISSISAVCLHYFFQVLSSLFVLDSLFLVSVRNVCKPNLKSWGMQVVLYFCSFSFHFGG